MTRKPPYKPLVHNAGIFTDNSKIIEVHGPAMDFKDREALIFPSKVSNYDKSWNLTQSDCNFFKKEQGREIDIYDELRMKYYHSNRRGLGTVSTFMKQSDRALSAVNSIRETKFL